MTVSFAPPRRITFLARKIPDLFANVCAAVNHGKEATCLAHIKGANNIKHIKIGGVIYQYDRAWGGSLGILQKYVKIPSLNTTCHNGIIRFLPVVDGELLVILRAEFFSTLIHHQESHLIDILYELIKLLTFLLIQHPQRILIKIKREFLIKPRQKAFGGFALTMAGQAY